MDDPHRLDDLRLENVAKHLAERDGLDWGALLPTRKQVMRDRLQAVFGFIGRHVDNLPEIVDDSLARAAEEPPETK